MSVHYLHYLAASNRWTNPQPGPACCRPATLQGPRSEDATALVTTPGQSRLPRGIRRPCPESEKETLPLQLSCCRHDASHAACWYYNHPAEPAKALHPMALAHLRSMPRLARPEGLLACRDQRTAFGGARMPAHTERPMESTQSWWPACDAHADTLMVAHRRRSEQCMEGARAQQPMQCTSMCICYQQTL
jgi:hypothetical protein